MSLWSRPGDDGLSASDRLVRDLKREGLPDAEIATRVGIPVSDVKQRLERLTAAPSTPAPRAPKRPAGPARSRPVTAASPGVVELGRVGTIIGRHWRLLALGVSAIVFAALVAGWAWRGSGSADPRILGITPGAPVLTYGFATEGQPLDPGITVTGRATATLPAQRAFIMPASPVQWSPTPGDRIVLANRLRAIGLPEDALEIASLAQFGNLVAVSVAVPVESVAELGPQVAEILGEVMRSGLAAPSAGPVGVQFALADCSEALPAVADAAIADARSSAERLASAAGLRLGPPIALRGTLNEGDPRFGQPPGCAESPADFAIIFSGFAPPFDSPPEVTVAVELSVTFGLEGQDPAVTTVTASGTAIVTAVPDLAYLVVRTFSNSGGPQSLVDDARWSELIDGLRVLDIDESQVTSSIGAGDGTVAVRISAGQVPDLAEPVLGLLRAYARVVQSEGIVYATQDCSAFAAAAEKAAAEDAASRGESLAASLGGRLGTVVTVFSLLPSYQQCPTSPDTGSAVPPGSPPELAIQAALQVTFAVEPPD